jgi:hypothetical protein
MRSKWMWIVLSSGLMTTIYFVPENSLLFLKKALEIAVVAHLGLELLQKLRQG